jgi:hypothetical protein
VRQGISKVSAIGPVMRDPVLLGLKLRANRWLAHEPGPRKRPSENLRIR